MPLDIHLDADPASIDIFAQWAGQQAKRLETSGGSIGDAQWGSVGGWPDEAGDHFRNTANTLQNHSYNMENRYSTLERTASHYAGGMRKVKATFHKAADIARGAGLKVDNDIIEDPGPPPPKPGHLPGLGGAPTRPGDAEKYRDRLNAWRDWHEKATAYAHATAVVLEGRQQESESDQEADSFIHKFAGNPPALKISTTLVSVASTSIAEVDDLKATESEFRGVAEDAMGGYKHLRAKAVPGTGRIATQDLLTAAKAQAKADIAARDLENAKIGNWFSKLPPTMKRAITMKIVDFLPEDSALVTKAPIWAKKIPVVGTAVTVAATAWDIGHGGDPYRDIASALAGIGASAVTGTFVGGPIGLGLGIVTGAGAAFGADQLVKEAEEKLNPPTHVEAPGKPNLGGHPEPSTKGTA